MTVPAQAAALWISDDDYLFIYSHVSRLYVDLLIRDVLGDILTTLQNIFPYKRLWHFPGGGVKEPIPTPQVVLPSVSSVLM